MQIDSRSAGLKLAYVAPWGVMSEDFVTSIRDPLAHGPEHRFLQLLRDEYGKQVRGFVAEQSSASVFDSTGVAWDMCAIDEGSPNYGRRVVSTELCERVAAFEPDIVVFKGSGTATESMLRHLDALFVLKQGGESVRGNLLYDHVLTESPEQSAWIRRRLGPPTTRLPKRVHGAYQRAGRPKEGFEFDCLSVGSLTRGKHVDLLANIAAEGFSVGIVGDGPLRAELTAMFAPHRNVTFFGRKQPPAIAELLARSRALVHLGHPEGFPRVCAEAVAVGRPVLGMKGALSHRMLGPEVSILVRSQRELSRGLVRLTDEATWDAMHDSTREAFERIAGEATFRRAVGEFAQWIDACRLAGGGVREVQAPRRRTRRWKTEAAATVLQPGDRWNARRMKAKMKADLT